MSFNTQLKEYQAQVEVALDHWLPAAAQEPSHLHEAMRYAVLGEGKRIRPVLVYAAGEAFAVKKSRIRCLCMRGGDDSCLFVNTRRFTGNGR